MGDIFGYARVSTKDQSLEGQLDALKKYGVKESYIYTDVITGKSKQRPGLDKLMYKLRDGDTLVIYKLDRMGRSIKGLIEIAEELENMGVNFISIQDNIDTSSSTGKFFFNIMGSLAQFERDLISERTNLGLEAARSRGRYGGRPKVEDKKINMAIKLYNSHQHTVPEITEITGVSKPTLYRYLKQQENNSNQ